MYVFRLAKVLLPLMVACVGAWAVAAWLRTAPGLPLEARVPTAARPPRTASSAPLPPPKRQPGPEPGKLAQGTGVASDLPGLWPWFRGENRDNLGGRTALARQWPAGGPPALWSVDVGEGHAGPVVRNGRVYLVDYDRENAQDAIRCLSLGDGKEIWRYSYPSALDRNHGMSRTVPAVTDRYVVAFGPKCHVTCLESASGRWLWTLDLVAEFHVKIPQWYAGQCPLIDGDRVILGLGTDEILLMAVDLKTGNPVWACPNPQGSLMTHSSILPMEVAGRRAYVYCGTEGFAGVSTEGNILWTSPDWRVNIATVPSPLMLPGGQMFLSGGYNSGAAMFRIDTAPAGSPEPLKAAAVLRLKPSQFGSTQHTPIYYDGNIYGVREKDKQLVCLSPEGKERWRSGSEHRFGLGPYLIADGLIFVMADDGTLTLAEASPAGYKQLAQAQVLSGHDAWGPMALVDGRLLVRDYNRMVLLDVRKR